MVLKNNQLTGFILRMVEEASVPQRMSLNPRDLMLIKRPKKLVDVCSLDTKLSIASKLGKRIYIVLIDDDKGLDEKEFSRVFRHPFLTAEKNEEIANIALDKGLVVYGNHSVSKYLQKAEMFLSTDMYDVMHTMKRLKGKRIVSHDKVDLKHEQNEKFIHAVLKMYMVHYRVMDYFSTLSLNLKQFVFLAVLFFAGKPVTASTASRMFLSLTGTILNGRKYVTDMSIKGYVTKVSNSSTHKKGNVHTAWILTDLGTETIMRIVHKIKDEIERPIGD